MRLVASETFDNGLSNGTIGPGKQLKAETRQIIEIRKEVGQSHEQFHQQIIFQRMAGAAASGQKRVGVEMIDDFGQPGGWESTVSISANNQISLAGLPGGLNGVDDPLLGFKNIFYW